MISTLSYLPIFVEVFFVHGFHFSFLCALLLVALIIVRIVVILVVNVFVVGLLLFSWTVLLSIVGDDLVQDDHGQGIDVDETDVEGGIEEHVKKERRVSEGDDG